MLRIRFLLLLFLLVLSRVVIAWISVRRQQQQIPQYGSKQILSTPSSSSSSSSSCAASTSSSTLFMGLTPIGPFCPFRSSAAMNVDPEMDTFQQSIPNVANDFTRLRLELQCGLQPDPQQLLSVADSVDKAVNHWEQLLQSLFTSHDFQTQEYAVLCQVHLQQYNTSIDTMVSMMRWQAACMRAMATSSPELPMPPENIDINTMMQQINDPNYQPPPSIFTAFGGSSSSAMNMNHMANVITVPPFTGDESVFTSSETVQTEYTQLCHDHQALIELGSQYGKFDTTGKLYYLDQMDAIQDRWDIFFTRFKLLGVLNPIYTQQCNTFLSNMGLHNEADYRKLLQQCHDAMRSNAQKSLSF